MKINIPVRFKNPVFVIQLIMAILTPILSYFGLTGTDLTSWPILGQTLLAAISNPYVCALILISLWNAVTDPTTKGLGDSGRAMSYKTPSGE